ncbi:MAG: transporter substrate-binding protein, partial [Pseudomonadota bacterium]
MKLLRTILAGTVAVTALSAPTFAVACPIKVGVLHSLSGTMAISETTLKDTMLMLIDDQNAKGGMLGCAFSAKSGQSEAGSTTTASSAHPNIPP